MSTVYYIEKCKAFRGEPEWIFTYIIVQGRIQKLGEGGRVME